MKRAIIRITCESTDETYDAIHNACQTLRDTIGVQSVQLVFGDVFSTPKEDTK